VGDLEPNADGRAGQTGFRSAGAGKTWQSTCQFIYRPAASSA